MCRAPSRQAVIAFYDRFGGRQDAQGWYEDAPLERLVAAGDFAAARRVCEFGCGTGRLAARLLRAELPPEARYLGLDASGTMARLAAGRLRPWAGRAEVQRGDGSLRVPLAEGACDRFVATYVLDLLPEPDIAALLAEAARVLAPGGRLCVAGLTPGRGPLTAAVTGVWRFAHRLHWPLVGGCRPLRVAPRLAPETWRVLHAEVVVAWGIPSEVLVAERRG
jgi:SAM-dependent methyltransferase